MQTILRRLMENDTRFIVVNTLVWLGLAALLLTDPFRLTLGGGLIALALGGTILYAGITARVGRGMAYPGWARGLGILFGLTAVVVGVWMLGRVVNGSVVPLRERRRRDLAARLRRVAEGSVQMDLSDLGLREVPPEVWQYTHVTWLHLGYNRLTELPPQIGNLAQLEELYAWDNRIASLPSEIGALSQLERLNLAGNRLRALPPELARCRRLTHVWLEHNRFATFPDVLLELPNLELLSLSGNRMGALPDPLTRRAEAGTLELGYRPYAVAFDGASVLVIVATVILPLLSAWGVHRGWTARERAAQEAARREGTVFPIPPLFRRLMLFVLFAVVAVCLVMIAAGLSGEGSGVTIEASMMLVAVLSPLVAGALYLLARHTGMVVLTRSGVSLRRLGRERFLPYERIVALRSQPRIGGPALVIRGPERTIRIPRAVEDLPRLYQQLRRRVPAAARDAAPGDPALAGGPVYAFEVDRRVWTRYVAGTVLLLLTYLGISLSGLWVGWVRGTVPPFTWARLRGPVILFALTSLLFVPAILLVVRGLRTRVGPFGVEQPVALQLFRDRLRYRFPRRLLRRAPLRGDVWHERPARALQRITLAPVPFSAQARVDGALASRRTTRYVLYFTFEDGTRLVVDPERAAQWGQTPEHLHAIFAELYGEAKVASALTGT